MNPTLQQLATMVRRYPFVVISVTLVVILSGVYYVLWQRQNDLAQKYNEVRHRGETMLLALTDRPKVNAELAAVQAAVEAIDQNLIAEGDLAENLGYFYQVETLTHVRLTQLNQLSAAPGTEGNPYKAIPFSLRITGTYAQIMSFLHELETGPRLLRIRSYDFGRGDAKSSTLSLGLTVEILGRQ